ncbi:uncharacterized protein LOC143688788 [Tamandua tetradactyla]|uniref:uncharacterized protein LOC143688788 n=1 Tax=Tamandua tetradactyla TaxID=48850 RepID=UPI0040544F52
MKLMVSSLLKVMSLPKMPHHAPPASPCPLLNETTVCSTREGRGNPRVQGPLSDPSPYDPCLENGGLWGHQGPALQVEENPAAPGLPGDLPPMDNTHPVLRGLDRLESVPMFTAGYGNMLRGLGWHHLIGLLEPPAANLSPDSSGTLLDNTVPKSPCIHLRIYKVEEPRWWLSEVWDSVRPPEQLVNSQEQYVNNC